MPLNEISRPPSPSRYASGGLKSEKSPCVQLLQPLLHSQSSCLGFSLSVFLLLAWLFFFPLLSPLFPRKILICTSSDGSVFPRSFYSFLLLLASFHNWFRFSSLIQGAGAPGRVSFIYCHSSKSSLAHASPSSRQGGSLSTRWRWWTLNSHFRSGWERETFVMSYSLEIFHVLTIFFLQRRAFVIHVTSRYHSIHVFMQSIANMNPFSLSRRTHRWSAFRV